MIDRPGSKRVRIAGALALALVLGPMLAGRAAAFSDKVKAPGFDGKYYPGIETAIPGYSPERIFERSCTFIHSAGNLLLHMSNGGFVGDFFGPFCAPPWGEWPPGSNNEYLFMAGIWVGALDADGNPHVTTGAYESEF